MRFWTFRTLLHDDAHPCRRKHRSSDCFLLRAEGHDVVETSVVAMEAEDAELIAISRREQRILITFDRDIGRLIQSDSLPHPGVVYLRLRGTGRHLWDAFSRIWPLIESSIAGHFVTVKNDQVRRRRLPIAPPW